VTLEFFDDQVFLKITDRKKKCSKPRRKILPQLIENTMKQSVSLSKLWLVTVKKMPAFIQPSFDFIKEWALSMELMLEKVMKKLFQMKSY
jgi:long-subunit acyl-CoA synthetase (AMP-forming)